MKRLSPALVAVGALLALGCGSTAGGHGSPDKGPTATTTVSPQPGDFITAIAVTLTADSAADIVYTTDGSDPKSSATRQSKPSPVKLTLTATTTLSFHSRTSAGAEEAVQTVTFRRIHYASGVVVVGESLVGLPISLIVNQGQQPVAQVEVGTPTAPGELPFTLDDLEVGDYAARGYAPIMTVGPATTFSLTAEAPFAEGVQIYLGAAKPGTGTLNGTVTFGMEMPNKVLAVVPAGPSAVLSGSFDLAGLIENGSFFAAFTTQATSYPYSIYGLAPGMYVPICIVTEPNGGIDPLGAGAANILVSPLNAKALTANGTATANFSYGPNSFQGTLTLALSKPLPSGAQVEVLVAARGGLADLQAFTVPVAVAKSEGSDTVYAGTFAAAGLKDQQFQVKVFATTDGSSPFGQAFAWIISVGSPGDAQARPTGSQTPLDLAAEVTVP